MVINSKTNQCYCQIIVSKTPDGRIALLEDGNFENILGLNIHTDTINHIRSDNLLSHSINLNYNMVDRHILAMNSKDVVFRYYLELFRVVPITTPLHATFFESVIASNKAAWRTLNEGLKFNLPPHQQSIIWKYLSRINFPAIAAEQLSDL